MNDNTKAIQETADPKDRNVKSANVTETGRQYILKTLTETDDPWKSVVDVQQKLSSNLINHSLATNSLSEMKRWQPAIALLDELTCPRSTTFYVLLEKLKNKLIKQIEHIITNTPTTATSNSSIISSTNVIANKAGAPSIVNQNPQEVKLIELLKVCIPMIATPELRVIPIFIIKKLSVIPKRYLSMLAKHNYLGVCMYACTLYSRNEFLVFYVRLVS